MKLPLALLLACVLTGCASKPQVRLVGLSSLARAPLALSVNSFECIDATQTGDAAFHLGTTMSPPPAVIVDQWAKDRFRARGGDSRALLTIEDASISEAPAGAGNTFTSASVKYTATISVTCAIVAGDGTSQGHVQAASAASRVVPESLTVAEREKVWLCLTENALTQLDTMLESQIRTHLSGFVSS